MARLLLGTAIVEKFFDDRRKDLAFSGVYSCRDGALRLLSQDGSPCQGLRLIDLTRETSQEERSTP
jgi:hypothetical protein